MPRAVELQVQAGRGRRPAREHGGVERVVAQVHDAAAALPERGAQRVALAARPDLVRAQHLARSLQRLQLQVAAADGADGIVRRHQHARAGLARHRALRVAHCHHDGAHTGREPALGRRADHALHRRTASMASSTASGVAGTRSGG
jgi:hypothetical protein